MQVLVDHLKVWYLLSYFGIESALIHAIRGYCSLIIGISLFFHLLLPFNHPLHSLRQIIICVSRDELLKYPLLTLFFLLVYSIK
jgi:hypothetical protein